VSAEKWRSAFVGEEERGKLRVKRTTRPAVLCGEESVQFGVQTQFACSALMVCQVG
jgi:hypothetical protein